MDNSKFSMWRACVAVVHLDQKISEDERIWVSEKLANLKLTVDQKAILRSDFENGITI